jgi:hypothetical protein
VRHTVLLPAIALLLSRTQIERSSEGRGRFRLDARHPLVLVEHP